MKKKLDLCILICLFLIVISCGNNGKFGKVIYESDDKKIKIYESEVNYELEKNMDAFGLRKKYMTDKELLKMKLKIVEEIALTKAIALEGKNQNLHKSKIYLNGLESAKEAFLASITMYERNKNIDITEAKLRENYEFKKKNFERKEETVRLQLIIINSNKINVAKEALKEALKNSNNFTQLVRKYSESNDDSDGETGEIPLSILKKEYPAIMNEIKYIKEEKVINKIIPIENELYIVKVLERFPKGFIEFDKIKMDIYSELIDKEREERNQNFINEILKKYKLDQITKDSLN